MMTDGIVADAAPGPAALQVGGEPRRLPVAPPGDGGRTAIGPLPGTSGVPGATGTPGTAGTLGTTVALDAPGLVAVTLLRDGGDLLIDYGTPGSVVLKDFFDALVRGEAPALKAGAGSAVAAARIAEALTAGERELAGAMGDDGEAPVFRDVVAVPVGSRVGVIALLGPDGLCFAGGIPAADVELPPGGSDDNGTLQSEHEDTGERAAVADVSGPPVAPAYRTGIDAALEVPAADGLLGAGLLGGAGGDRRLVSVGALNTARDGLLILNADGSFSYMPPPGFSGDDVFEYSYVDADGTLDVAAAAVTVGPASDPPALDDQDTRPEEGVDTARGLVPEDESARPVTHGDDGETGLETGAEAPAGPRAPSLHHDGIEMDIPVAGEAVAVRLLVTYDRDEAHAAPGIVDDRVDLVWFDGRDWAPVANGGAVQKQVGVEAVRLRLRRVDDGGRTLPADPARFSFAVCEMDADDAAAPPQDGAPADIPPGDTAAVSHALQGRSPAPSADIISLVFSAAPVLKAMPVAEAEPTSDETELPDFVYGIEDMDPTAGGRLPDRDLRDPMADPMGDPWPDLAPDPAERPERERDDGRPPLDDAKAP